MIILQKSKKKSEVVHGRYKSRSKGMVLSGDNDTLVYTGNGRKPRGSERKEAGFQDQGKDNKETKKIA